MMTTVVVQRTTNAKRFRASIDNIRLEFNSSGKATKKVKEGKHVLSWTVEGKGSKYTIKMTSPASTGCGDSSEGIKKEIESGSCKFST
jgi:hypothetical protein